MKLLFNENWRQDTTAMLAFMEGIAEARGLAPWEIDVGALETVAKIMRQEDSFMDGCERASAFKKAASFVLAFVAEKPITQPFPADKFIDALIHIPNHQNAYMALLYAMRALRGSHIIRNTSEPIEVTNPLELSQHSFIDIVDAISTTSHQCAFKLVAVLLEQVTYKTNRHCQYDAGPVG